ncbi:DUF2085 domain-containing protein [Clostridium minihomine]|uniref:DUF2085 domain-containing protein n=1 Tax=Clostridium minihomine TaxID=2045012 RepID=UPI001FB53A56|nr:DUF2085 domain-containing protein [Clostridium minihomine]
MDFAEQEKPKMCSTGYVKAVDINLKREDGMRRWIKSMEWFARHWGCHQMPERSFSFRNYQFPLCARCTGIITGEIVSLFFSFFAPLSWKIILLLIPMAIDGFTQLRGWRTSTNLLRFITGLLGGYAIIAFLFWIIKFTIYSLLL